MNVSCVFSRQQVLFKMDKDGQGIEFQYCDLVRNKDLDFTNFTRQMVLEMCIMSGCDYLSSLPGLGVKRAHGLIKRMKTYKKAAYICPFHPCSPTLLAHATGKLYKLTKRLVVLPGH